MLLILKKITYVMLIVFINSYVCSYLGTRLSARMELRRGYRLTRAGGIGFPAIRAVSYLARGGSAGIWVFMTFLFSLLMWAAVPFNLELAVLDMNSSLLAAVLLLLVTVVLNITGTGKAAYGIVKGLGLRRTISVAALMGPFLLSVASIILVSRSFSLKDIVDIQRDYWNIVYQPFGFLLAVFSVVMIYKVLGLNRQGRMGVRGISDGEGPGLSRAVFRFSRYSMVLFMVYLITLVYLGGYKNLYFIRGDAMLGIKFYAVFLFIILAEKALTSHLQDNALLMRINGKFLLPMSLLNFVVTLGFFIYRNIYGPG